MRSKIVILVVAFALGIAAAFFAAQYLNSARARLEADAQPVEVLVAQQDLPVGSSAEEMLEKEYVKSVEVPRRYVSDNAVSLPAAIKGKVLAVSVSKGEQLTASRFKTATEIGLAYNVPKDYVAISVRNDAVKGVSGLVRPGDHVAVFATFTPGDRLEDAITKIILKKVRVLATGATTSPSESGSGTEEDAQKSSGGGVLNANPQDAAQGALQVPMTITLALSPADAEKLVFAEQQGRVWLALLSSDTAEIPATAGQTFDQVLK